jgi:hypothetical protein
VPIIIPPRRIIVIGPNKHPHFRTTDYCESFLSISVHAKMNQLFGGHPETGERSAVIYTLLGSCQRHGVTPFDCLPDLFTRLPAAKITQIREFTPAAWAKAREKADTPAA